MAVYLITDPSPKNTARDMSVDQDFTFTFQGDRGTDYQLIIMNNSTSAVLYDSTKINLGTSYWYNGEQKSVTVPSASVSNNLELKWTLQTWDGTDTVSTLEEIFFNSYANPTLALTVPVTITAQSYEFIPVWSQAEGLSVKKFQAFLYDSNGSLIDSSQLIESGNIRYTFEGFIDGDSYEVQFLAYDEFDRVADSTNQSFTVDYAQPNVNISPTATSSDDLGAIVVGIGEAVVINGVETGVFTYVDNFLYTGDKAVNIPSGGNLYYDISIPSEFTVKFPFEIPTGFTGAICTMDGNYEFGYDGSKFYISIGGILTTVMVTEITGRKWYAGLRGASIYLKEIGGEETESVFGDGYWNDNGNWNDNDIWVD